MGAAGVESRLFRSSAVGECLDRTALPNSSPLCPPLPWTSYHAGSLFKVWAEVDPPCLITSGGGGSPGRYRTCTYNLHVSDTPSEGLLLGTISEAQLQL